MPTCFRSPRPRRFQLWCLIGLIAIGCCFVGCFETSRMAAAAVVVPGQTTEQSESGEGESPVPSELVTPDRVRVTDVSDDDAIQKRIYGIIAASGRIADLNVEVKQGLVFLSGNTPNGSHSQWAESLARKTEDVNAVINDIEVVDVVDLSTTISTVRNSLTDLWKQFVRQSPLIVAAVLILCLTALIAKLLRSFGHRLLDSRKNLRANLADLLVTLLSLGVWIVGFLSAAVVAFPGMTPAKALTVLGLGSVAIGFAFKDIFENFFAGILILWRYPFDRDDMVAVDDVSGRVQSITLRNTLIERTDGELVVVPNATIFKSNVEVLTHRKFRRVRVVCGVAYDTPLDEVADVVTKAIESCETPEHSKPIQVFAQTFNASSIDFEIAWWTRPGPLDIRKSRDEVIRAVKRALDDAGIEIPFPIRTILQPQQDAPQEV